MGRNRVYGGCALGIAVGIMMLALLLAGGADLYVPWTAATQGRTTSSTYGSVVLVSDQPITVMVDQFNNVQNKFGAYTPTG